MTTTEHLQRIKAKCLANLAIAEKRTAGKWTLGDENNSHYEICMGDAVALIERQDRYGLHMAISREEMRANGGFIIECSGAAEAGWRSTIAAINLCIAPDSRYQEMYLIANEPMVSHIIAAWPEELL
jgi:hypothetical protein